MQLPEGVTERDFLQAVEQVMDVILPKFLKTFGPTIDADDLRQQGFVFALELMAKGTYKPELPIASYIFRHVRRRMLNLVRDKVRRSDPPCKRCHSGDPCGDRPCKAYKAWVRRQSAKANLMSPERMTGISKTTGTETEKEPWNNSTPDNVVEMEVEGSDLAKLIDEHLSVELRQDYLKMLAGVSLEIPRKRAVRREILKIVDATNGRQRLPILT